MLPGPAHTRSSPARRQLAQMARPLANDLLTLRKELLSLSHACGEWHPSLVALDRFDILDGLKSSSARDVFNYQPGWGLATTEERAELRALMMARAGAA